MGFLVGTLVVVALVGGEVDGALVVVTLVGGAVDGALVVVALVGGAVEGALVGFDPVDPPTIAISAQFQNVSG